MAMHLCVNAIQLKNVTNIEDKCFHFPWQDNISLAKLISPDIFRMLEITENLFYFDAGFGGCKLGAVVVQQHSTDQECHLLPKHKLTESLNPCPKKCPNQTDQWKLSGTFIFGHFFMMEDASQALQL